MANISSKVVTVASKIIRPWKTIILIIVFIILFSLVAYYTVSSNLWKKNPYSDVANKPSRTDEISVYFAWAGWCPHCKSAKPFWNAFSQEKEGTKINDKYTVRCIDVDCTNADNQETQTFVSEYSIQSYPTVFMIKPDGSRVNLDGKVTKDNLNNFLQTMTQ